MKNFFGGLKSFVLASCVTVMLAGAAAAQCDYLLGGVDQGVTCYRTGQDSQWCYYTCYCTGTASQCDRFYAANGLIDA